MKNSNELKDQNSTNLEDLKKDLSLVELEDRLEMVQLSALVEAGNRCCAGNGTEEVK